jgi:uncharacterized damage-inducible protein DinB
LELVRLDPTRRSYKPHEKCMPLARLATHVAEIPSWPRLALATEVFELQPGFEPHVARSTAELIQIFERSVAEGRAAIEEATDEEMQKSWTFRYGELFSFTEPRTRVIRSFLNHLIHHRAQLGVYLRLQGVPIPGMYGPSADEALPAGHEEELAASTM